MTVTLAAIQDCANPVRHTPKITRYIEVHHIWPRGWDGPDIKENKIPLCGNCHRLVHEILEETVRLQRWPDWVFLRTFSPFCVLIAQQAIQKFGGIPPKHFHGKSRPPLQQ